MTAHETLEPLPLPDDSAWSTLGLSLGPEIHGGHQSRVFAAERHGEALVVKLVDGRVIDRGFHVRLDAVAALADIDDSVVGPIPTNGNLAMAIDGWLAVISPFAPGERPDVRDERDVRRMAATLAGLHRSLDRLEPFDLPTVAALDGADVSGFGPPQLLHGDYSHTNVILSDRSARVIDFDDCGYGPVEFEVGNTLYMALFDAAMSSETSRYRRFRECFVDAYRSASGRVVPDALLDRAISLRVEALGRWVEHPETAPIGIRNATVAWRDGLRAFVQSQGGGQHTQL